jgi:hypothetical protein
VGRLQQPRERGLVECWVVMIVFVTGIAIPLVLVP